MVNGKQKSVSHQASATFRVEDLKPWAVGMFNGGGSDGLVTLTVGKTGKITGKWQAAGLTWALNAASFATYDADAEIYTAYVTAKSGKMEEAWTLTLTAAGAVCQDAADELRWEAYQNNWKVEPWKSRAATFGKVPVVTVNVGGDQTVTLKFAASGAVTAAGEFVTGVDAKGNKVVVKATCSTVVTPEEMPDESGAFAASVYVYFPPKGAFAGCSARIRLHWNGTSFAVAD